MKKQHAMKKILVIAILGLAGLEWSAQEASAWCLRNCFCCKKCRVKLYASQYNAFSPYCLDSISGCLPVAGLTASVPGCGAGGCFAGNGYAMGELPAPGPEGFAGAMPGPQAFAGPMMMGPTEAGQGMPGFTPGMMSPNSMPMYYPANTGAVPFPGAGR
jgi:hypothetical protein